MTDSKIILKKIETAIEIEEGLGHLIRLASPTKEKVYRIYRQFRDWGYHHSLEDIERKCERYYTQMNRFNQSRLIRELFRIQASSEVASCLALNFRSAKLDFAELNEVSTHLFSLLKSICRPEDFGIDCFLTQIAVKRLTSPSWNDGDIFFNFADFFDALEWASFRRYGSRHHDQLSELFYSMDPVLNAEFLAKAQGLSKNPEKSDQQAGLFIEKGGVAGDEVQSGEIERQNEKSALNENFSANTQVIKQAELLWLRELESHIAEQSNTAMPSYPLKHESKSKEIREIESQVRLFNSIILLGANTNIHYQKYTDIEMILQNTIALNIANILHLFQESKIKRLRIKGPGADQNIKKTTYVLPEDLSPKEIFLLVEKLKFDIHFKWEGEIEYQKFSTLFVLKANDLYSYYQSFKAVA